ncbi:glycosyltransferase family 2 protein [Paenibacillus pabuli]|uniref:glycosyltransferase family 2 protein n=1 Tax=Paenibacillus pabuli TaxID=1472 RepID=UPI0007803D12|nr:glycosyltransferase family 2 protein [Paenibacillus pabuli]MEC0122955.1 glycosyltransferase family 2 protein [Paenibacillus pabuli]
MQKRRNTAFYASKSNRVQRKAQVKKRRLKSAYKKGTKAYKYVIPPVELADVPELGAEQAMRDTLAQGTANSHQPMLSVVIPAMNEERTIGAVVRQALRICRDSEVLVVVNGSTDGTAAVARRAGAQVLRYTEALGHDGGRRVGAAAARGRVLLFTDADIPIPAEHLAPYVRAILEGTDVALNDYDGPVTRIPVHPVVEAKHALNSMLARPDLKGASMTAIPHALSRRALEVIGADTLETPPLAHAMAVTGGLKVRAVHHVPVGKMNPLRVKKRGGPDLLSQLVWNDHLTAIRWITDKLGPRGGHSDLGRVRSLTR